MIKKVIVILVFTICSASSLYAGDKVGNGGGIAEQNISYAFLNLHKLLQNCLVSPVCVSQKNDRDLISKIYESLELEYSVSNLLVFLSGNQHPEIFYIDKSMRTAVTGNQVMDLIYINVDLIYSENQNTGIMEPMSIPSAIGLLIHELGHHHGVYDHTYLDFLGAQLKAFSQSEFDIISADNFLRDSEVRPPEWTLTAIHSSTSGQNGLSGAESLVLFADELQVYDLTNVISNTLSVCPATKDYKQSKMIGYRLYNFSRRDWRYRKSWDSRVYYFVASVLLYCQHDMDPEFPIRYDNVHNIQIEIPMDLSSTMDGQFFGWMLDTNNLKVVLQAREL